MTRGLYQHWTIGRWLLGWMALISAPMYPSVCFGTPETLPWAMESGVGADSVSSAQLSGWYSVGETTNDTVEIRDVRQTLLRLITRQQIEALAPWMSLDASSDGPRALAWSDSGRSLFIVVTDDAPSPDGLGSDAVLRYDTTTRSLSLYLRAEIGDGTGAAPAIMHLAGTLWVSTQSGGIRVYLAGHNDFEGVYSYTWTLPNNEPARGMAAARSLDFAFVVSDSMLYRVDLALPFAVAEPVGEVTRGRGVAYSDHSGQPWYEGAYVIEGAGAGGDARVMLVPRFQATGLLPYAPNVYMQSTQDLLDISSTADGRFLLAGANNAESLYETDDPWLGYEAWVRDEFDQIVSFARGLVSPDGEPAGWVIDADVAQGGVRFHPASPDGAAWVILLQIVNDSLAGNEESEAIVREILQRYAGVMPDGIGANTTTDGIMRHWYDPMTGNAKPGWDPEYATLSTMLMVLAADRAMRFYSDDAGIVSAAQIIIDRVHDWDRYIQIGTDALYLRAIASGGPDFGTAGSPFFEGVIFVDQAAVYGSSQAALDHWLDRTILPSSEYVDGLALTTNWAGNHLPAFVSLYPWISQYSFRSDPSWREDIENLLGSNGAWTDDHAPLFLTVFSAGTTRADWGGYHADSLSDHPGDVTTFPSLLAFSSLGSTAPSVGAYHAYRHGARQTFAGGASILFRRSNEDPNFSPNDGALSDIVLGAMGLAELISPGTIDAVLAVPYGSACPADLAEPTGELNFFDVSAFLAAFASEDPRADFAAPFGSFNFFDVSAFLGAFAAGCP